MTFEIILTFLIIALAVLCFVKEWFTVDTVSAGIMLIFIITGILTPEEGFAGFNNSATLTVAAMFVLSAAIFKTGVLNNFTQLLLFIGKSSYLLTLVFVMVIAGCVSAFINDTSVVALLLPVVVQVSQKTGISSSRLLIPLSFAALMGGTCTLIGTSTNILVSGIAERNGLGGFSMFLMSPAGICFLTVGTLYLVVASRFLLPDRKSGALLDDFRDMGNYLTEIVLLPDAKSAGKALGQSRLVREFEVEILRLIRKGENIPISAFTIFNPGDIIKVKCNIEKLRLLEKAEGIQIKADSKISIDETKLFEATIPPGSAFNGKTLAEINFRNKYQGAAVLAIRHRDGIVYDKLAHSTLMAGDVLLLRADSKAAMQLKSNDDLIIFSKLEQPKPDLKITAPVLGIALGIVLLAAFNIMPIVLSAALGIVVLIGIKAITPDEAYKAIDWKVIFMLAGVLSMGAALEKTGASKLLSTAVVEYFGHFGPQAILSVYFLITMLLTNIMSNNATAALLAPVAIQTAHNLHVSPIPFLIAITCAASFAFMSPIGYQTNVMVYTPGNYRFNDFARIGIPLSIIMWLLGSVILPVLYPF